MKLIMAVITAIMLFSIAQPTNSKNIWAGLNESYGYADFGWQIDQKPRFPLKDYGAWDQELIRDAWFKINLQSVAEKYESQALQTIKNNIIWAWMHAIDSDGPPSTSQYDSEFKADIREGLQK